MTRTDPTRLPLTSTPPPGRFLVLKRAVRKRLGWYPFRWFDTRAKAEAEARYWYYRLACTKYETDFAVAAEHEADARPAAVTAPA